MIVTTSYKSNEGIINRATSISRALGSIYVERNNRSIQTLLDIFNDDEIIIVEKGKSKYLSREMETPFFFHPSIAILRINRLKQGDNDLMVNIAELKQGDTFLDCTLGLATDSIVASYIVGELGNVVGFESQSILSTLVSDGLQEGWEKDKKIDEAMKRINVLNQNHLEGLKSLPDNSFDIVYFDPMFRKGIHKSSSMNPLRSIANDEALSKEVIKEAVRVAKRRVILKENKKSNEFERLGFRPISRSANITFGVISIKDWNESN